MEKYLRDKADEAGTDLFRVTCKMATGSGKTPGITIRDRLRVLLPSDPNNYYKDLDLVPVEYRPDLGTARVVITNFHAFKLREKGDAGGLTKRVLTARAPGAFTETPDEMVNRVCRELGTHR